MNSTSLPVVLTSLLVVAAGCGPDSSESSDAAAEAGTASTASAPGSAPILIAHRGASAYAPEHSREAYELGIEQGADYIEPDLQITRDGVLISLHDLTLERTTNVREVFPDRGQQVEVRGEMVDVWPAVEFTLEEIKQLDAGSWFSDDFAGTPILTFSEVIELAKGRAGLFIETKAPEVYGDRGFDMEALVLAELAEHGLDRPGADPETPIVIQSFSAESLKILDAEHGTDLPLALLIGGGEASRQWLTPEGLAEVATFASGIGPNKAWLLEIPGLVEMAHEHGLSVVPWTFRGDDPGDWATVDEEMAHFVFEIGVDGIITNNPDLFPTTPPPGGP